MSANNVQQIKKHKIELYDLKQALALINILAGGLDSKEQAALKAAIDHLEQADLALNRFA